MCKKLYQPIPGSGTKSKKIGALTIGIRWIKIKAKLSGFNDLVIALRLIDFLYKWILKADGKFTLNHSIS